MGNWIKWVGTEGHVAKLPYADSMGNQNHVWGNRPQALCVSVRDIIMRGKSLTYHSSIKSFIPTASQASHYNRIFSVNCIQVVCRI